MRWIFAKYDLIDAAGENLDGHTLCFVGEWGPFVPYQLRLTSLKLASGVQ